MPALFTHSGLYKCVLMICFKLRKYSNILWYVHLQNYDTLQQAVILPL